MKNKFFLAYLTLAAIAYSPAILAQQIHKAQPQKNELYVGYGRVTIQEIAITLGDAIGGALATSITGHSAPSTIRSSGAISAGYLYHPSRRVAIGLSGTAENIKVTFAADARNTNYFFYVILLNGRFYYLNKPAFNLYSGIGAGYCGAQTTSSRNEESSGFAFQVNVVGFRLGRNVAAFGELGFGFQGIVHGGLSLRF